MTLSRSAPSLSGGESQRIRLAGLAGRDRGILRRAERGIRRIHRGIIRARARAGDRAVRDARPLDADHHLRRGTEDRVLAEAAWRQAQGKGVQP